MSRERRIFDRDFKINAVLLVQRDGSTMKQISKDLGINYQMLAEWKKEYEKKGDLAFPGNGKQLSLDLALSFCSIFYIAHPHFFLMFLLIHNF